MSDLKDSTQCFLYFIIRIRYITLICRSGNALNCSSKMNEDLSFFSERRLLNQCANFTLISIR